MPRPGILSLFVLVLLKLFPVSMAVRLDVGDFSSPPIVGPALSGSPYTTDRLRLLNAQFRQFAETFHHLRQEGDTNNPGLDREVEKLGEIAAKMINSTNSSGAHRGMDEPMTPVLNPSVKPKTKIYSPLNYSLDDTLDERFSDRVKREQSRTCKPSSAEASFDEALPESDVSSTAMLVKALSRLDGRKVPRPGKYDSTSGRPLGTFLEEFEEYCRLSFRGSSSLWAAELEEFFVGPICSAYQAFYNPGESYHVLKDRLLGWFSEYRETIHERTRRKFDRAQAKPGEPLRLYAARLEKLFVLAYPSKNVNVSKTLQRKFLDTVPRGFKKHVFAIKSFMKMQKREIDWSNILPLTSNYDAEHATTDSSGDSETEITEVWASTAATVANPPLDSSSGGVLISQHSLHPKVAPTPSVPWSMPSQPWVKTQTNDRKVFESRTCHFCNKKGHIKRECRRFNKQCLACGSDNHIVSECVQGYRNQPVGRGRRNVRSQGREERNRHVTFETPDSSGSQYDYNSNLENY